jgi:hypothetical protein
MKFLVPGFRRTLLDKKKIPHALARARDFPTLDLR